MRKIISSKHLESISDLTLCAPIKQGFVDAFESVTYETRLRLLLKGLFKLRATAREYALIQPFVDTSARIHSLLDYRIAILDTEPKRLLLSATFDRPFEPYMRLIWDPLGPLLDVIFCNCEDYVTATEHGFPDYLAWVRQAQIDSNFFYAANGHSVDDIQYAIQIERLQREQTGRYSPAKIVIEDAEEKARLVREVENKTDSDRMGVEALVALYRLTDVYPPDHPEGDGKYLRWATQHLLAGWKTDNLSTSLHGAVAEQLVWYQGPGLPQHVPDPVERLIFDPGAVQGGILHNYGKTKHGALLLMRITDPAGARDFIGELSVQAEGADAPADGIFLNLAFTGRGLENIGVSDTDLAQFPQEFLEGMEERAGLLGDLRERHPRRWTLPERNWPAGARSGAAAAGVELSEVDFVIQLRTATEHEREYRPGDDGHPLHARISALAEEGRGVRLLSVQPMSRLPSEAGKTIEHFGFTDGISQPVFGASEPPGPDTVPLGDLLWGYANSRADAPPPPNPILDNGTFLVVRKLRQNVGALDSFVAREIAAGQASSREDLLGKMVGRFPNGDPLTCPGATSFDYVADPKGERCPFQAHIRRANPRAAPKNPGDRPTPRILRRGMTYGPPFANDSTAERGIMFMACVGSIAEQFEVIQRWINGGNPTGVASWQNDPLTGIAPLGGSTVFRFILDDRVRRVTPDGFVDLQWGAYLFMPSMAAIKQIVNRPGCANEAQRVAEIEREAAIQGESIVARLLATVHNAPEGRFAAAASWKTYLEDFSSKDPGEKDTARGIWAAIRQNHGGALRVPYGIAAGTTPPADVVLVASKELVMRVFSDPDGVYSMCGQMERMRQSFGEIFLGRDESESYHQEADRTNAALFSITEETAFEVARTVTDAWLVFVRQELADAFEGGVELDLRGDFITRILSGVCNQWFGIPDFFLVEEFQDRAVDTCANPNVDALGWGWQPIGTPPEGRRPRCPGDYMSTSRYCFYPDPHPRVQDYGKAHGQGLRAAARAHFEAVRQGGGQPKAPLAAAMSAFFPDNDELARMVIGVMTGFLPPADGSLRWAFYDWLEDKTLWRVQDALLATDPSLSPYQRANAAIRDPLERAMQKRPSPDILWRTATRDHRLGSVDVRAGDRVFIGIVSALAEDAANGVLDTAPIFGGRREPGEHSPLHACPAYKAAMGTMLGMISGLLEAGRIEALPAPLLIKLSEPTPPGA